MSHTPLPAVEDRNAGPEPSGTAERVAAVIDAVVRRKEVGVRELATALGISRSATHRIAQVLARRRVLHALPSGRYVPGAKLLAWAASLATRDPLLAAADVALGEAAAATHETAYLVGHRAGESRGVVLNVWPGSLPIRYTLPVGASLPLHAGAAGKAMLAWLDGDVVAGLEQPRLTEGTLTPEALAADLLATRERGYAISFGEQIPAAVGVAAPLLRDGQVIGAAGFTIPRVRATESTPAELGELARDVVERIGAELDASAATRSVGTARPRRSAREPSEPAAASGRDVARVVDVIDALARSPAAGVDARELAAELAITPATASATVARLERARLARRDDDGRHLPDVQLLGWPGLLPDHDVVRIARDLVEELVAEIGETVCLLSWSASGGEPRFVLCQQCDQPIRHVVPLGTTVALHSSASGKAILAHVGRDAWPRPPLQRYTDTTITSIGALEAEIEQVREQGFAVSVGEHQPDAVGIAAAYFVEGVVAGALSITMPRFRFDPERATGLANHLRRCCDELTDLLSSP